MPPRMYSKGLGSLISRFIDSMTVLNGREKGVGESGQATVEAALLLPLFLVLLLLALQPVCILYTRAVMEGTAAQVARLMITGELGDDEAYRAFALRRLSAVPDLAIFHAEGPRSWSFELERASQTGGNVRVAIEGSVRPLPILGAFVGGFGGLNERGDVVLRVEVAYDGRPAWLEGDYETWVAAWGA